MRVLTFLHSFEPGGVERIALRLVRQWRAEGVDAPLFIGRDEGAMRADVGAGLDFTMPRSLGKWIGAVETPWMIATLPAAVRRLRPDVLFCAGNTYVVVAVALRLLLGRACPPIVAKISNDLDRGDAPGWQRGLYRLWLRAQGGFVDHVVGMEEPMRDEIRERLGLPGDAITVIPDPALSRGLIARLRAAPRTREAAGGGRRFVAVGRLAPQKNVALMLRAFARGSAAADRLTVIGDGPERAKLETLARRLGIGERVAFAGYLADPATILPGHDILLLSSNYEGVPAVVLEALAASLAIVATDCSRSMATLLQHGALGQLVAVGDEAGLSAAIRSARAGSQHQGLSLAQAERFTVEQASEAYLATMARLAGFAPAKFYPLAN